MSTPNPTVDQRTGLIAHPPVRLGEPQPGDTNTLIMAVPWVTRRAKAAVELSKTTGGMIVWDQDMHAFHTWRSVLRHAGSEPVIILEDDVILGEDWRNRAEAVIADGHTADVIQFFSMRAADLTVGSRYEPGRTFVMNQCYYLPAHAAEQLLEFCEGWEETNPDYKTGYDIAMGRWMQETGRKYWLHVPSLVQHRDWKSEINHKRPRNRQSRTFQ